MSNTQYSPTIVSRVVQYLLTGKWSEISPFPLGQNRDLSCSLQSGSRFITRGLGIHADLNPRRHNTLPLISEKGIIQIRVFLFVSHSHTPAEAALCTTVHVSGGYHYYCSALNFLAMSYIYVNPQVICFQRTIKKTGIKHLKYTRRH